MSAFIVDKAHIDALVTAGLGRPGWRLRWYWPHPARDAGIEAWSAASHELRSDNADEIGDMLVRECVRSVSYRYPDNGPLPGPCEEYWHKPYRFRFTRPLPAVAMLKAISCYEYQACEHPEWEESEAKAFCNALHHHVIPMLPGYEEAEWEISEREGAER